MMANRTNSSKVKTASTANGLMISARVKEYCSGVMRKLYLSTLRLSFCGFSIFVTDFARSKAKLVWKQIFLNIRVSLRAVCFGFLSSPISFPAKSQPIGENSTLCTQNLLQRKTVLGSGGNGVRLNSNYFGKLCGFVNNTINNDFSRIEPIELLLRPSRPSTIFREITLFIVNPIKRISVRPASHIGNKISKSFTASDGPSTANSNPSAPITMVARGFLVFTSLQH